LKKIHTFVNHLTRRHVSYQALVCTTVTVGSTSTDHVNVNYLTTESISLQRPTTSCSSKRTMESTCATGWTLTSVSVTIQAIKKAYESVSQSIQRISKCRTTHCGQDFGILDVSGKGESCEPCSNNS